MKTSTLLLSTALIASMTLVACGGRTNYDTADLSRDGARSENTVSHQECMIAAKKLTEDALQSPIFNNYIAKFQRAKNDTLALPLTQVGSIKNQTNDPNFNRKQITDVITTALLNSGKVEVTLASGSDVASSTKENRDLEYDDNFDQSTVTQRNTLQAPDLSVEGTVGYNLVKEGRTTDRVYFFHLKIYEIKTGKVIWANEQSLGTEFVRPVFGL